MTELRRLRRAGGDALHLLVDLLPHEWDPRNGEEEVTVVFADVSGYSDFVAEHGDDAALRVLEVLDALVLDALSDRRGTRVVKRLGDGLMLAAKRPHDALRVAAALVDGFTARMHEHGWPLRLRAGVHRGPCRRQGSDYFGYHVNLAARVAEAAPGGRVLSSPQALDGVDLPALGLAAVPVGRLDAKGLVGPIDLFLLVTARGESPAERRRAS